LLVIIIAFDEVHHCNENENVLLQKTPVALVSSD